MTTTTPPSTTYTTAPPRSGNGNGSAVKTVVLMFVLLFAGYFVAGYFNGWAPFNNKLDKETAAALTVDGIIYKGDTNERGLIDFRKPLESQEPVGTGANQRWWGDSLALPLDQNNMGLAFGQLQYAIWHNPDLGVAWAIYLANHSDKVELAELNKWLEEYAGLDYRTGVQDKAMYFMPLFGMTGTANDEELKLADQRNREYQVFAGSLNTLLMKLHNDGKWDGVSTDTIHQVGPTTTGIPVVDKTSNVDALPWMRLSFTQKGVTPKCGDELFVVLVNLGDKRPGQADETCVSTPSTPGTPGKPPAPGTTPPGPPPPSHPPYNPPPTTNYPPPPPPPTNPPPPGGCVGKCYPDNMVDSVAPLAPQDGPPRDPAVPEVPFVPGSESLPGAPITGDPGTNSGAAAPGSAPVEADVDRGSSGAGTPAPVDSAAETPSGATGIGESTEPVG